MIGLILRSGTMKWAVIIIIIFSIVKIHKLLFGTSKAAGKNATKSVSKIRITKTTKNKQQLNGKKLVKFMIEHNIHSAEKIRNIKADMRNYGGVDFEFEAGQKIEQLIPLGIVAIFGLFMTAITSLSVLTILFLAPAVYIIWDTTKLVFFPDSYVKDMIKTSSDDINRHFRDFFNHVYYYYAQDGQKVILSNVMSLYLKTAPLCMQPLARSILADAEKSELLALQNLRRRYSKSQKICEFSNKLEKRISGHIFGKQFMTAMRDSVEDEYEAYMNELEESKQEKYIGIMISGIGISLTISILACSYVILLTEGVLNI